MKPLFDDIEKRKVSYGDFQASFLKGTWNWGEFFSLSDREKESAMLLLLDKGVVSISKPGNYEVIRAPSCNEGLVLPKIHGQEVYFTSQQRADRYRDYLATQACLTVTKERSALVH